MSNRQLFRGRLLKAAVFIAVTASLAVAQTPITAPKNNYTPAQDVELGQQAAKEVEQQLPLLRDDGIESFVDRSGWENPEANRRGKSISRVARAADGASSANAAL